jgi:hypothetical protein
MPYAFRLDKKASIKTYPPSREARAEHGVYEFGEQSGFESDSTVHLSERQTLFALRRNAVS